MSTRPHGGVRHLLVVAAVVCGSAGAAFTFPGHLELSSLREAVASARLCNRPPGLSNGLRERRLWGRSLAICSCKRARGAYRWGTRRSTIFHASAEEDIARETDEPPSEYPLVPEGEGPGQTAEKELPKGAMAKLKGLGLAGVIAYGMLNQVYYALAFAFLWLGPLGAEAISPPAVGGVLANVGASTKQFGKVTALVWLGSQATKPARVALALVLAPAGERALVATERRLGLPSRERAFWVLFAAILASTVTFCTAAVAYAAVRTAASAGATAGCTSVSTATVLLGRFPVNVFPVSRSGKDAPCTRYGQLQVQFGQSAGLAKARKEAAGLVRQGGETETETAMLQEDLTGKQLSLENASILAPAPALPTRKRRNSLEARRRRMSPQQAADRNPPMQDNIHGWNEHPNHLLGLWRVDDPEAFPPPGESWAEEAKAAAAPSVEAAAVIAAMARTGVSSMDTYDQTERSTQDPIDVEAGGYSYRETAFRDRVDLGSDILHHVGHVVLRRGGALKAGPMDLGVGPRSWRFTPANRRLVFEVDVPGRGVTLRYSGRVKRSPGRFTRAKGTVRVRPMSHADGDLGLPSSSRTWPKLAQFCMEMQLSDKFKHKPLGGAKDESNSR